MTKRKAQFTGFKPPKQTALRTRRQRRPVTEETSTEDAPNLLTSDNSQEADTIDSNYQDASLPGDHNQPQGESVTSQAKGELINPPLSTEDVSEKAKNAECNPSEFPLEMEKDTVITMETLELLTEGQDKPNEENSLECAAENESCSQLPLPSTQTVPDHSNPSPPRSPTNASQPGPRSSLAKEEWHISAEMDPKPEEPDPERGTETLPPRNPLDGEIQPPPAAADPDLDVTEPPAKKKKTRKRMGMCGLGERGRRSRFDGQLSGKDLIGGAPVGEAGKKDESESKKCTADMEFGTALVDEEGTAVPALLEPASQVSTSLKTIQEVVLEDEELPKTGGQGQDEEQNTSSVVTKTTENAPVQTQRVGSEEPCSPAPGEDLENAQTHLSIKQSGAPEVEGPRLDEETNGDVTEEEKPSTVEVDKEEVGVMAQEESPSEQEVCVAAIPAAVTERDESAGVLCIPTENGTSHGSEEDGVTVTTDAPPTPEHCSKAMFEHCEPTRSSHALAPAAPGDPGDGESSSSSDNGEITLPGLPPSGQEENRQTPLEGASLSTGDHDHGLTSEPDAFHDPEAFPSSFACSVSDSQLDNITLTMRELEDQSVPECSSEQEDATELVCGLIRELSSLNRIVMAAHRQMENIRHGNRIAKPLIHQTHGPHHFEL